MSTKQLTPVWMQIGGVAVNGTSLATSLTSDQVEIVWEDNVCIQFKWTGTPTGTIAVQTSLDPPNLGWADRTFTSPTQPAGSASGYLYELSNVSAGYVRFVYTRVSGTGALYAKIAAKSI